MVRMEGVEPTHLTALDPKSSVSTNFTTSAFYIIFATFSPSFALNFFKAGCKDNFF